MNRLIILEGADRTGKTTLAKWLMKNQGYAYYHATAKGQLAIAQEDYLTSLLDSAEILLDVMNVVMDRHWLSEACYQPVLRPEQSKIYTGDLYDRLEKLGAIYVFCFSNSAKDKQLCDTRPHQSSDFARIEANYVSYSKIMKREYHGAVHTYSPEMWGDNIAGFYKKVILGQLTQ